MTESNYFYFVLTVLISGIVFGAFVLRPTIDLIMRRYFPKYPIEAPIDEPLEIPLRESCPFCPESFSKRGMSNHIRSAHPSEYRKDAVTA